MLVSHDKFWLSLRAWAICKSTVLFCDRWRFSISLPCLALIFGKLDFTGVVPRPGNTSLPGWFTYYIAPLRSTRRVVSLGWKAERYVSCIAVVHLYYCVSSVAFVEFLTARGLAVKQKVCPFSFPKLDGKNWPTINQEVYLEKTQLISVSVGLHALFTVLLVCT